MSGINTEDDWIASFKNPSFLRWAKTGSRTTVANLWYSFFDVAGYPGAGTLAGGQSSGASTSAGIVPTDATAGYPDISDFATNALGYLTLVDFSCVSACRFKIYDRLWVGGAYNFNANTTLSAQPAYSGRLPFKSDGSTREYANLEIWAEQVTAATGTQSYAVTYTNQAGTTAKSTGTIAATTSSTPVGECKQLPLAAGDTGVQKIESVVGSVASAGTFNIMVLRHLATAFCPAANMGDVHDLFKTGMPQVFQDSAIYCLIATDGAAGAPFPDLSLGIASK